MSKNKEFKAFVDLVSSVKVGPAEYSVEVLEIHEIESDIIYQAELQGYMKMVDLAVLENMDYIDIAKAVGVEDEFLATTEVSTFTTEGIVSISLAKLLWEHQVTELEIPDSTFIVTISFQAFGEYYEISNSNIYKDTIRRSTDSEEIH